jgi:hypothetical protein
MHMKNANIKGHTRLVRQFGSGLQIRNKHDKWVKVNNKDVSVLWKVNM